VQSATRDDAAGEALDKGAKLLGLGYPGGPLIEQRALAGGPMPTIFRGASSRAATYPSVSPVSKTSLRYLGGKTWPGGGDGAARRLVRELQQAVIDALVRKTAAALDRGGYTSLGLSGGVSHNRKLRAALEKTAQRRGVTFLAAQPQHTGDNAGMIAFAAWCDPAGCVARRPFGAQHPA